MKIFLVGFMGSGKTYWGKRLSEKLGIALFDLDEQVVKAAGKSINEIFEKEGEEYFRQLEKATLEKITAENSSFVLATGGGTPCYFNTIEYMNNVGTTVWLNTSPTVLFERLLKEKEHRPLLRQLSDEQLMGFISKKYGDRRIYYEQAAIVIEDEDISTEQFIEKIFHA